MKRDARLKAVFFKSGVSLHFWVFVVRYDFRVGVWCTVFIQRVFRFQLFPIQFWILMQLEKMQFLLGNNFFTVYLELMATKYRFLLFLYFVRLQYMRKDKSFCIYIDIAIYSYLFPYIWISLICQAFSWIKLPFD